MNKKYDELAVDLVVAWLNHESEVSQQIGATSNKGRSISVEEVAQAYLDFAHVVVHGELRVNKSESDEEA